MLAYYTYYSIPYIRHISWELFQGSKCRAAMFFLNSDRMFVPLFRWVIYLVGLLLLDMLAVQSFAIPTICN